MTNPLGVIMLATVLRGNGFQVEILDANEVAGPDMEYRLIPERILDSEPDMVGFSTVGSYYALTASWAKRCKMLRPSLPIVFGGSQASLTDIATLESFPFVDVVARGESERSVVVLAKALGGQCPLSQVPGISYRHGGAVEATPSPPLIEDLDELPAPDFSLFSMEEVGEINLEDGRGCPFRCAFCSTSQYWRRRFRTCTPQRIVDQMESLFATYGDKPIRFTQDTPFLNETRIKAICAEITTRGLDSRWRCYSRLDLLSEEIVRTMAAAGCDNLYLGVETGSQRLQRSLGKNLRLEQVIPKAQAISDARMEYTASFILGFPDETQADLLDTARMIMSLRYDTGRLQDIMLHDLEPQPGMKLLEGRYGELEFDDYKYNAPLSPAAYDELLAGYERGAEVFSVYYYLPLQHLERMCVLKVHYLLECLLALPLSGYVLYRDQQLGLFDLLAGGLDDLELNPKLYNRPRSPASLRHAAQFITNALCRDNHVLPDVLRCEIAAQQVTQHETESVFVAVCFDVIAWSREVREAGYGQLPLPVPGRTRCLLFRHKQAGGVSIVDVPPHLVDQTASSML